MWKIPNLKKAVQQNQQGDKNYMMPTYQLSPIVEGACIHKLGVVICKTEQTNIAEKTKINLVGKSKLAEEELD